MSETTSKMIKKLKKTLKKATKIVATKPLKTNGPIASGANLGMD